MPALFRKGHHHVVFQIGRLCADFIQCAEKRLGRELAEFLDGLAFPFEVANLLPRPATAASVAARDAAAKEVARA